MVLSSSDKLKEDNKVFELIKKAEMITKGNMIDGGLKRGLKRDLNRQDHGDFCLLRINTNSDKA